MKEPFSYDQQVHNQRTKRKKRNVMNIGVLKELKKDERRVALQPVQAAELIKSGHRVLVEHNAGALSRYTDQDYLDAGATVVNKQSVLDECELLLKVKAPLEIEYQDYKKHHTLFTYLHFDENIAPEKIERLIGSQFTGIAYEWVEEKGDYPLLSPMSVLTGYLFAQKSIELCTQHKGILCGGFEKGRVGARILLIGLGRIGLAALAHALGNRLQITVVDKHPDSAAARIAKKIDRPAPMEKIEMIGFNQDDPIATRDLLAGQMDKYDIIINCAVRRPDLPVEKLRFLIDEAMVQKMEPGSVICDATGCDKDMIETCVSKESLDEFEIIHEVIHYNCDHIPSLVGRTATDHLTAASFPYIKLLADLGINEAISSNQALRKGVSCMAGKLTHLYSATKKNMPYTDLETLL
jgi:alanine dehydrogenase